MRRSLQLLAIAAAMFGAAQAEAKVIGFEAAEGYTAGNALVGQPSAGAKWTITAALYSVQSGIGAPGNAARAVAADAPGTTTPTVAGFNSVRYAPNAADFGGNAAPITAGFTGQITYSMDLAVLTPSDVASSIAASLFYRFGSDDVEFFVQRDGNIEIRSSAGNFLAKTATATDFDFDSYGTGFVHINGVADYAADTFTMFVNGVQQQHGTAGFNIPFKNTDPTETNFFDHIGLQTNAATNDVAYRQAVVDNVAFAVPEPASLAVLVGGLPVLLRRRRV